MKVLFGQNNFGQLGTGNKTDFNVPQKLLNIPPVLSVCCGAYHTLIITNDSNLWSCGSNQHGQLCHAISCGENFSVCVDYEGFIWSFGENNYGQLGTGNKTYFNVPQKLLNIPPVLSVSCGFQHTLIITNNSNLWSCGGNDKGQLCHGDKEDRSIPQKTSFSNISKISAGHSHSLFQNNKGKLFACGYNQLGQCGSGHFNVIQITPSLILNLPSNIVQFVCGYCQNFLDIF